MLILFYMIQLLCRNIKTYNHNILDKKSPSWIFVILIYKNIITLVQLNVTKKTEYVETWRRHFSNNYNYISQLGNLLKSLFW